LCKRTLQRTSSWQYRECDINILLLRDVMFNTVNILEPLQSSK
jgi:hypothetical protein